MRHLTEFPNAVRQVENAWIPMSDGVKLAARLWLPENAADTPVPAVLEYIPYRKRDGSRVRDAMMHHWFAGHGYAGIRVDLRGSGDSGGVLEDEYLEREIEDGIEVLEWLSRQPWCTGDVGMIGKSWGGFSGLQIAARQPPQLKAVITVCSSDNRYSDDVHHMGGCVLGDNLSWASTMFSHNSLPPDPELAGDAWRDVWFRRLEGSGLWLDTWLRHQRRDAYWRHGSVCEHYEAIRCPVYAVGGWVDGYTNAVFRLLENLSVPRKGLVGPWGHRYPHEGVPGPAIGFLEEALRWWDRWLKDIESGVMEDPALTAYMQDSVPPTSSYAARPGRWVSEPAWPSPNVSERRYRLAHRRLVPPDTEVPETVLSVQSPLSLGLFAGKWCSYTAAPDLPHDQRQEDGGALLFDSDPLCESLEILGAPVVELDLAADREIAMVAVRLSDVHPDDKASRVTYGLLNLTHRDSSEHPEPVEPDRRYRIRLKLNHVAQVFPKGHRLRIAVSTSYWPLAWPPPEPVRLRIFTGGTHVTLPVRGQDEQRSPAFSEPEAAAPPVVVMREPERHNWRVIRDLANDLSTLEVTNDDGVMYFEEIDLEVQRASLEWYTCRADDFNSVRGETWWTRRLQRGGWRIETGTRTVLTSTATEFRIHAQLDAYEGDRRVYSRNWQSSIDRDFV